MYRIAIVVLDTGAACNEGLDQLGHHAGLLGPRAGHREVQRRLRRAAAIRHRERVGIRATREQQPRDRGRVRRRLLALLLDTVRADIMQQRRAVPAQRARGDEVRLALEQRAHGVEIAGDDRVGRILE